METKSTFQFMRFNVHGYGTTISTSAGAESSVYTLDFTPKTANVYVIWTLTCTYPLNNGVVQAWGDIASGPANIAAVKTAIDTVIAAHPPIPL